MNELRVAVVGAGRIGLTHSESLVRRVHGARLVAATTSNPERAERLRNACGAVTVYRSIESLLEAERLDAVIVASSSSAHVENVERLAVAGLHILCEKPLALDLGGCDRAIRAAEGAGVKLMIGHVRQFDSGYVEAKRLIDAGAIGRPVLYRSISGDMDPPPPSFADLSISGGLILDSMYHDIYLGRWLMADEIVRVHGEGEALIDDGVRSVGDVDNAVVSLRFAGGAMGSLTASRVTRYGHDLRGEVIGDEGAVQIGSLRRRPVRLLDRNGVHHDTVHTTGQRMGDAFGAMLQSFIDCVNDDIETPVTARDARATVAAAIAATESIRSGSPVKLEEDSPPISLNEKPITSSKE
jgi:scyllo-inositol 2-dehydrogenase (NAD+)